MYDILTLQKASELLGIAERTLAEKARAGIIPAYKFLGRWYFFASELGEAIKKEGRQEQEQEKGTSPIKGHQDGQNITNMTSPKGKKKSGQTAPKKNLGLDALNANQKGQINAANNPDYANLVDDIKTGNYSNKQLADNNSVSLAIVKKVKGGLNLIEKYKL